MPPTRVAFTEPDRSVLSWATDLEANTLEQAARSSRLSIGKNV